MTVYYEWDRETVSTVETEENLVGDVLDHNHSDDFTGLKKLMEDTTEEGEAYVAVLVRDDDNGRSWAYMEDGKVPEYFRDAYDRKVAKVPKRFAHCVL